MKKIIKSFFKVICIVIVLCTGCYPIMKSNEKEQGTVKILSYNVRNCRGIDDIVNYKREADVIKRLAPDVVALHEFDSATQRSNGTVVLGELASLTGMHQMYNASIEYLGGKYGVGILTREKPIKHKVVRLPGREEKRCLLIVELKDYKGHL